MKGFILALQQKRRGQHYYFALLNDVYIGKIDVSMGEYEASIYNFGMTMTRDWTFQRSDTSIAAIAVTRNLSEWRGG